MGRDGVIAFVAIMGIITTTWAYVDNQKKIKAEQLRIEEQKRKEEEEKKKYTVGTSEQKEYFENCFGISRFAYNWFIYTRENNYKKGINKIPNQLFKDFMDMKNNNKEYEFLKNINSKIIKAALLNAKTAYENWFNEQNRKPKYKTKKEAKKA